ncbi:MAG TPA: dephospho-CoA kinase [Longimicrobium sp.]|jgi:dephospho-CoA kinase|uniref:dephospho-CoA kinase n=1 Tax=Longimicrobium sp. TaxID=2029185 RepID=UPI002ED9FB4B
MLKVGLTGNIAAGKSTVASAWRELGATVVDADELSRQAVEPGTPAHAAIAAEWGTWVLEEGGTLDRAALRQIVFADPDARARLESIVHPAVAALRDDYFRAAADRGEPLVVADVPLLFEVGMADEFDVVVLVDAPEETRLMRLVGDRGLEPEEARRIMAAQMPAELKRARADVVIENTGSLGDLQRRALEVWEGLVRRAEARG